MDEQDSPAVALQLLMIDVRNEAALGAIQLGEIAEYLVSGQYVRALGAFQGLEARVHYVGVILHRFGCGLGPIQ